MTADPYLCELCGRRWVVPALARACEQKHLDEEKPVANMDERCFNHDCRRPLLKGEAIFEVAGRFLYCASCVVRTHVPFVPEPRSSEEIAEHAS